MGWHERTVREPPRILGATFDVIGSRLSKNRKMWLFAWRAITQFRFKHGEKPVQMGCPASDLVGIETFKEFWGVPGLMVFAIGRIPCRFLKLRQQIILRDLLHVFSLGDRIPMKLGAKETSQCLNIRD